MADRTKRTKIGIESLKDEIESHFKKIEDDIKNKNLDRGLYHIKELDRSLIHALKHKLNILGKEDKDIERYEEKLKELNKRLEGEE